MKLEAIICLFFTLGMLLETKGEVGWKMGQSYKYSVRGRMMNGLTEINRQYTGMEMDHFLTLTPVDTNRILLKTTDLKLYEVNDVVLSGWHDSPLEDIRREIQNIPSEIKDQLESPVEITFTETGEIATIKVESNLPVWIENMKRGLVSHWTMDRSNMFQGLEITPSTRTTNGFFFQKLESTIHGECKTYYSVSVNDPFTEPFPFGSNALPEQEQPGKDVLPWHETFNKLCNPMDQVYEVIKTINFTDCVQKPVMSFMTPSMSLDGRAGDNHQGSGQLRNVVSRMLGCGNGKDTFTILKINHEEQVKVGLHLTQKIMSGALKNFTLLEIVPETNKPEPIKNPKVLNSIVYKYSESHMERDLYPMPNLVDPPTNPLIISPLLGKMDQMKERISTLLHQAVQDLLTNSKDNIMDKETLSKISVVSKIFRYLSYKDIQEVYEICNAQKQETPEEKLMHGLFLDAVSVAGTNPNVKFLMDMIRNKKIVGTERISQILMTFPAYIRFPTPELLREYFKLIQSGIIPEHNQIGTTGLLSFSTILYEACMNSRIAETRFPVQLYGKFCDADLVEKEFLPHFVQNLEKLMENPEQNMHWIMVYIKALENIGHPKYIPVVKKWVTNCENSMIRQQLVFSLRHMTLVRDAVDREKDHEIIDRKTRDVITKEVVKKQVLPILSSIAFNRGEHPNVRKAAMSLLFYTTEADQAIWQQLAFLTWIDMEDIQSFVYHSFKSMAQLTHPVHHLHRQMQIRARQMLPLCKPIRVGIHKSRNIFDSEFLDQNLSGFFTQLSYYEAKDSAFLPNNIYYRNYYHFGGPKGFGMNFAEISVMSNSLQKLWDHIYSKLIEPSSAKREVHPDLVKLDQVLNILDRKQTDKIQAVLGLKLRQEIGRMWTLDKETIDLYVQELISDLLPKLNSPNGVPIQYQKTLRLTEYTMEIPTTFGLPLNYKYKTPIHFQVRGNLKMNQMEIHPMLLIKSHHKLSVKVPFLQKKYETGLTKHVVVRFPCKVHYNMENGLFRLALTPVPVEGKVDLISYHQKPYTGIMTDEFWPTMNEKSGELKLVRSAIDNIPYKNDRKIELMENLFGVTVRVQEETDYRVEVERLPAWMKYFKNFKSFHSFVNLGLFGVIEPSTKYVRRVLSLDMNESQTKTMVFVLGGGRMDMNMEPTTNIESKKSYVGVVGVIGMKNVPVTGNKILDPTSPYTMSHLVYVPGMVMTERKMIPDFWFSSGKSTKDLVLKFPTNLPMSLVPIREYFTKAHMDGSHAEARDFCLQTTVNYEQTSGPNGHDIVLTRRKLLEQDMKMKVTTQIVFGPTCTTSNMEHKLTITGEFHRNEKMTRWAKDGSNEAKKCVEDEKKGWNLSPICLWVSKHQAGGMNEGQISVDYTANLPRTVESYFYKIEDFVKFYWFDHFNQDRHTLPNVNEKENRIQMKFEMSPDMEFVDIHLVKPETQLWFHEVPIKGIAKYLVPITGRQNLFSNIRDRTLRMSSRPFCSIEKHFVSTFDNVTYEFDPTLTPACEHLLFKDCTTGVHAHPIAVWTNEDQTRVTIILPGRNKIQVLKETRSVAHILRRDTFRIVLNDKDITTFPYTISTESTEFVGKIELMTNGGVQVIGTKVEVAMDGERVVVFGHNDFRNRTCGVCGNFDGEKMAEFKSSRNCPLGNGNLMFADYSFSPFTPGQDIPNEKCQVKPEIKSKIESENKDCMNREKRRPQTQQQKDFEIEMENLTNPEPKDCMEFKKMDQNLPNYGSCTSRDVVPTCKSNCRPESTIVRKITFECQDWENPRADSGTIRKEVLVQVPVRCVSLNA